VFPNRRGRHLSIGNIRRRIWYPTLEKASLKPRDLYNARHTFATHALASGEDPSWVAKMLGHTTLSMLVTRYYRYVPNLVGREGSRGVGWRRVVSGGLQAVAGIVSGIGREGPMVYLTSIRGRGVTAAALERRPPAHGLPSGLSVDP